MRRLLAAAVLLVMGLVGWQGWKWQSDLRCQYITVDGNAHAERDTLLSLARVDTMQRLYSIDPVLVADRLRRHPWVREAEATRRPTGTLAITVQERRPVALALDAEGLPAYYLDGQGYMMPVENGPAHDVPLLRGGAAAYNPLQPVTKEPVRSLLAALAELKAGTAALVSELEVTSGGEVSLRTTPTPDHGSLRVRLGGEGFRQRMQRLHDFWRQAVIARPELRYEHIDLRFKNQIITRETTP